MNISYDIHKNIIIACAEGKDEIVQDLLKNSLNTKKLDISYNNNLALNLACAYGHLNIVISLCEYDDSILKVKNKNFFKLAFINKNIEIIHYLIENMSIPNSLYKWIEKESKNKPYYNNFIVLINNNKLKNKLEKNLPINNCSSIKKI